MGRALVEVLSSPHTVLIAPGGETVERFSGEVDPVDLRRTLVKRLGRFYAE